jgi:DNA-binding Lrp family transcriptional regulator
VLQADELRPDSVSALDRRLLAALHANGRASWAAIAKHADCSPSTAQRHVGALHRAGVVRVVGALDVLAAGVGVPVLVRLRGSAAELSGLADRLQHRAEVRFLVTVTGSIDCVAEIVVGEHADLQDLIPDLIGGSGFSSEALPVMRTFTSGHDWSPFGETPHSASLDRPITPRSSPLTEAEREVVRLLVRDGRTSPADLAAAIGRSESTAARIVENLERSGLLRFRTLVEPPLLGFHTEFMVWVSVAPQQLEEAGRTLARHPATKYLSATVGRYNLVGQILLAGYEDVYRYATEVLGSLPGIREVDLTLQMRTYKRVWTPVTGDHYAESPQTSGLFGLQPAAGG